MKKSFELSRVSRWVIGLLVIPGTLALAPKAEAISWVISPDGNAFAFDLTAVNGLNQVNFAENLNQPAGIYGAGFTMTGGNSFSMNFDANLQSWDSYTALTGPGTGYWDAFVVTVSTADYYWNLPQADPITPSASTFVWGGTLFGDGLKDTYNCSVGCFTTISLFSATPTTFYVSLVLDTKTLPQSDTQYPSWGSFHVSPTISNVPEPSSLLLLGSGLLGLAAYGRKKLRNG